MRHNLDIGSLQMWSGISSLFYLLRCGLTKLSRPALNSNCSSDRPWACNPPVSAPLPQQRGLQAFGPHLEISLYVCEFLCEFPGTHTSCGYLIKLISISLTSHAYHLFVLGTNKSYPWQFLPDPIGTSCLIATVFWLMPSLSYLLPTPSPW